MKENLKNGSPNLAGARMSGWRGRRRLAPCGTIADRNCGKGDPNRTCDQRLFQC